MVFFLATFHTYGPFFELLIISHSFWARLELWTVICFLVVVMPLVLKYVIQSCVTFNFLSTDYKTHNVIVTHNL
jgi:hypothetical protein